ncbi:prepilin peptidase [Aquabacter spiritensis]|uniref:Prepilin peptidase CpaA n=1 Tax=Aquabacter spiritensis TaxID=933073 RepID=A0A4R3M117_9HYPH|nr:prepilin peptidase [Aquabacter spiritensis]TCT06750.1 prepilin peptidase CpaA [Aquabacter spiritensis]
MIPTLGDMVVLGLFPAALALAIVADLFGRVIPNAVIVLLLAGFAALAAAGVVPELPARFGLAAGVLAAGFALFWQDVIGAGDAKLAASLALWLDPAQFPLFAAICGGLGALLVLWATLRARAYPLPPSLPYGVALAGAGLLLFPHSSLMAGLL